MTVIDMSNAPAALLFADSCGVTVDQLRSAVDAVGSGEFDVRTHLQNLSLIEYRATRSRTPTEVSPPMQVGHDSRLSWKQIDSAPQDGERVLVFVRVESGDSFIAIGSSTDGDWRLEIDNRKHLSAVITPALWMQLPQTMPMTVKRE